MNEESLRYCGDERSEEGYMLSSSRVSYTLAKLFFFLTRVVLSVAAPAGVLCLQFAYTSGEPVSYRPLPRMQTGLSSVVYGERFWLRARNLDDGRGKKRFFIQMCLCRCISPRRDYLRTTAGVNGIQAPGLCRRRRLEDVERRGLEKKGREKNK